MAKKGGFTDQSVRTMAAGSNGKMDGRKVDPSCDKLYLWVRENGKYRAFQFRYDLAGTSYNLALGAVGKVSLAAARTKAREYNAILQAGGNPKTDKAKAPPGKITYRQDAEIFHSKKKDEWVTAYARNWWADQVNHVFPIIGDMETAKIAVPTLVDLFQRTWVERPKGTHKLLLAVQGVIDYAIDCDDVDRFTAPNPTRKVLSRLKGGDGLNKAQVPHPSICWRQAPALFANLAARPELAAKALCLDILIGTPRANEILGSRWNEIDSDTFHVPAARMKAVKRKKQARDIPLTDAALKVLASIDSPRDGFIFTGRKGKTLKDGTHVPFSGGMHRDAMNCLLKEMAVGTDVHGLRSMFRTWVQDNTGLVTDYDAAELCLGHTIHGLVARSYARSDMMNERRALLERWAKYLGA